MAYVYVQCVRMYLKCREMSVCDKLCALHHSTVLYNDRVRGFVRGICVLYEQMCASYCIDPARV